MEIKVIKKLGEDIQLNVTAEGSNLMDMLFMVSPIINAPKECGKCQGTDITIRTKYVKNGGNKFISYACNGCGAELQWGQYKEVKDCYFLKDWQPPYDASARP